MPKRKFEDEELLNLYIDQDLSSIKIAQIFGVRVSSVCRRLQKLNAIKPAMGHEGRNGKRGTVYINGYPVVYMPSHPRAKSNGYVREQTYQGMNTERKMIGYSVLDCMEI